MFTLVHIYCLPDGRGIVRGPRLVQKHTVGQILVEVSTFHVLSDHTEGVAAHTHSQQSDDVGILQAGQDFYLFQEVIPTRMRRTLEMHQRVKERRSSELQKKTFM